MYAKVENGIVTQTSLPTSGTLSDGRSVSNYNLLPESVLLAEGWLPLELNQPEYNPATQELQLVDYTIEVDGVIANYEAVALPVETPNPEIVNLNDAVMGITELIFTVHPELL
jgi:hypothetical protein